MDAEAKAFFGIRWYDLPGNLDERAQGEERFESIMNGGTDPVMNRYWGTVTVSYSNGATKTLTNPTLDEYQQVQTAYLEDSGAVDLEHNIVTIYGGAQYFVQPQKPDTLSRAFDKTRTLLNNLKPDSKCAKLLGPNAIAALDALQKIIRIQDSGDVSTNTGIRQVYGTSVQVDANGGYAFRNAISAIVFSNGPFFNGPGNARIGGYPRGSNGAQITALLHEIAHSLFKSASKTENVIPDDVKQTPEGRNVDQSVENTNKITKECGSEIHKAAG